MNYIIFPDIHGRKFWKPIFEKYEGDSNITFIFLGDYLDHYSIENQEYIMGVKQKDYPWLFEDFTQNQVINNFKDILNSVRERDILLIGNHDLHYLPPLDKEYGCRRYNSKRWKIQKIFYENLDRFKVSHVIKNPNGKDWLFSHAGFLKEWFEQAKQFYNYDLTIDNVNDLLKTLSGRRILNMYGYERGSRDPRDVGSCLWADVSEHFNSVDNFKEDYYQIFGHTINYPDYHGFEINDVFAMLDSSKAFYLDTKTGTLSEIITENYNIEYYNINELDPKNDVIVFSTTEDGKHIYGGGKQAIEKFGAKMHQTGFAGNSYAIPFNKNISKENQLEYIKELYEIAKANPDKKFKFFNDFVYQDLLNGYSGIEMMELFKEAGKIPNNLIFTKEWVESKIITKKDFEN